MKLKPAPPAQQPSLGRWRTALGLALLFVVGLSFIPLREKIALHTKGQLHDVGHVFAFAMLSFLVLRSFRSRRACLLGVVAAVLVGWTIEFGQHLLYNEAVELMDMGSDAFGAMVGTTFALLTVTSTRHQRSIDPSL